MSAVCSQLTSSQWLPDANAYSKGVRKTRCSGELPACERCLEDNVQCVYSTRSKMGRPRKRRRQDEIDTSLDSSVNPELEINLSDSWMDLNTNDGVFSDPVGDQGFPLCSSTQVPSLQNNIFENSGSQQFLFQPTLNEHPSSSNINGGCSCIQIISSTLSDLQALRSFHFPTSLWVLRKAVHTIGTVVECNVCPTERASSIQNVLLLQTVLTCLVERYHALLAFIDAEAERVESAPIRIGDWSKEFLHLHTGTPDCPMGITVNLEGKEWRVLARKAVKDQIEGPGETLLRLMDNLEARQRKWHDGPEMQKMRHFDLCGEELEHNPRRCLSHLEDIRRQASRLIRD